ncbi:39kDa subunit of Ndufa9, NADH ubiquinone oxidoreductase [Infundibulicybe gibba]|nr:39kDa subunit of Ndufa9, NADH ubiquinone oxidoreductase [Infundibulicybe gibba]
MIPPTNLLRLHRSLQTPVQRAYHDLVTLPSQKPIVSSGPPGYSAVSGHVVTVFGCTGFLGRYLVSKLGGRPIPNGWVWSTAKLGTQVIVPYRDEDEARHLKPMGDLGQVVPMEWDIRNENQIAECVRHSDIVYNLVGRDFETKNFDYTSVHVAGAERIAKIAAENGVSRLVHVSHLNASTTSKSKFYKTKAEGEERVMDVAQALANLMAVPRIAGTLSLPGPSILTYEYLLDLVSSVTLQPPSRAPVVPQPIASALAKVAQTVWWPTLSPDEVIRRYIDDADVPGDWETVGLKPAEVEQHAITYLRRYRSAENFVRPIVFPSRPTSPSPVSALES